jgi:serine/threonine protein phosphatase PrpC
MIAWIQKRIDESVDLKDILDELLNELVAKDPNDYDGTDNMTAILIKFG